jgi:hypothetical protein
MANKEYDELPSQTFSSIPSTFANAKTIGSATVANTRNRERKRGANSVRDLLEGLALLPLITGEDLLYKLEHQAEDHR